MMELAAAGIICQLSMQGVTMAYMDGRSNVLVRRCTYKCEDKSFKRHQIYYDDRCPIRIYKHTKSLYYG